MIKTRKVSVYFCVGLTVLLSCTQRKDFSESKKIYDESILIHDEVMPFMGKIMALQKSLKEIKENLTNEEEIIEINKSLQDLENAHQGMMNWMRTLTPIPDPENELPVSQKSTEITESEMMEIQKKSLENIKNVKIMMLESIAKAEEQISRY